MTDGRGAIRSCGGTDLPTNTNSSNPQVAENPALATGPNASRKGEQTPGFAGNDAQGAHSVATPAPGADLPAGRAREHQIRRGIEWFEVRREPEGDAGWECQCARCGSSVEWVDCARCGGEGYIDTDDWQDFEDDDQLCPECGGKAGDYHCISERTWCEAHPMPGRESIASTALSDQAWRDVL